MKVNIIVVCNIEIVFFGDYLFKILREVIYLVFFVYFMLYLYVLDIRNFYLKFVREFVKLFDVLELFGIELV